MIKQVKTRGHDTLGELIDRNSPVRRIKKQIQNDPNPEPPYYVKLTYHILEKKSKQEKKYGQLKKSIEKVTRHQLKFPFGEYVDKILIGAKLK